MQRSNQRENTRSHQNTEVKRVWAGLVLGRVISWEPSVTLCFSSVAYDFWLAIATQNRQIIS